MKWTCPACTLFQKKRVEVNVAPFHRDHAGKENQGNAHLGGKRHARAIEHMWLTAENIGTVFSYIDDFDPELDSTLPIEAFKNYTRKCGGDVEKHWQHFLYHRHQILSSAGPIVNASKETSFRPCTPQLGKETLWCGHDFDVAGMMKVDSRRANAYGKTVHIVMRVTMVLEEGKTCLN